MDPLTILLIISGIMMLLVTLLYAYQFIYLFIPLIKKRTKPYETKLHRYAVMIAARNEELVLPHLLDSIHAQDYPSELVDIYVVADNCTDNTAQAAREHGAIVFERFNNRLVGKGYAVHDLLEYIKSSAGLEKYDAFLVFDADNLLEPDYISQINRMPCQGFQAFCGYRNTKNYGTNWLTSGYALWYLHESSHMNRSRSILGVGCHVNGTGFGYTRQLLEQLGGWNFFTLTEDIEFSNYCAINGIKIGYCHEARLYDEQPFTFKHSWKQRTRWSKGGIQVSLKYGGSILRNFFRMNWQTQTCAELFSLSLWGFGYAALASILSLSLAYFASHSLVGLALAAGSSLLGGYFSMAFMAFWTLVLEWKHVRASKKKKIISIFTFPLFMFTFVPTAVVALFSRVKWDPIPHTVAISSSELSNE
ncbi:MAG: glycosyltransferase [Ruminococcaceae bacterium]|nr:glycosyltransferase [Oscillospiraceae bacterium]